MTNEHGKYMDSRNSGTETAWSGCCVRFDSRWGYPTVYANSQHIAVGVKGVKISDAGHLEISHEGGPIVTMFASPDETMVGKGIQVGLSGGGGKTTAKFYDATLDRYLDLSKGADWLRLYGEWSNLWLGWLQVVER